MSPVACKSSLKGPKGQNRVFKSSSPEHIISFASDKYNIGLSYYAMVDIQYHVCALGEYKAYSNSNHSGRPSTITQYLTMHMHVEHPQK